MRKFLLMVMVIVLACASAQAAKMPDDVRNYIKEVFPTVDIRFDGVIILPSNTVYLPLYPSLFTDIKSLKIKQTYPENKTLAKEPDIVIFNNDFVLMKVLTDGQGHKTVLHQANPPLQVRTALLPQDMLVPSGLIIPENIKGIIGNLKIDTKNGDIIKVETDDALGEFVSGSDSKSRHSVISILKNKTLFATTNYSKNIQVIEPSSTAPVYSLTQKSIPVDVKAVLHGKFLLVTSYQRPFLDVVSVADSRFIKQIELDANPEQILLDEQNNKAYVASPSASTIYTIDLETMALVQKIKINGYCEHMLLSNGKMFYVDKLNNQIWAIELNNNYELKEIGKFPNVSALAFADGKLYIASRTKSRIAVVDYDTVSLENEFTTVNKPTSMLVNNNKLYILGAQNNEIQVLNTVDNSIITTINLGTNGFSSGMSKVSGTSLVVICDLKQNLYSLLDLSTDKIVAAYSLSIPIKDVVITDKVRLFE